MINQALVESQDVTLKQKHAIKYLHTLIDNIYDFATNYKDNSEPGELAYISDMIEQIEFELQTNWNFDKDSSKHKYQFKLPGCTCPSMDSRDLPDGLRWVNQSCAYHGHK